ncbi:DUF4350 domain-containing protein [Intrasporangium flavum]|uniref:DUF4350 domain-containing protein n=1 Tax=Intrasporangium flavum TaxID=1428657 RepID=UPI00096CB67A|nr:DUF4350 domain-containing protein [Intrasporangium flavum]
MSTPSSEAPATTGVSTPSPTQAPTGVAAPAMAAWNTTVPPRAPRSRRRTVVRLVVLAVVAAVAIGLLVTFVTGPRASGLPLDPDDTGHGGARAVAEVLRRQGVDVSVVRSVDDLERTLDASDDRADWTVVLTDASYLGRGAAQRLTLAVEQTRRFVLVEPDDVELDDLGLPLTVVDSGATPRTAGCTSDVADPTDRLTAAWSSYGLLEGPDAPSESSGSSGSGASPRTAAGATLCFPGATDGSDTADGERSGALVVLPREGASPETVVLGSKRAVSNGQVLDASHGALTLRAFGPTAHLLWYVPGLSDLDAADPSGEQVADPGRGVPDWLGPAAWLLAAAVIAFALARGRRLGRLVVEPLPVVVRAAETTEARGRLYHRAADRPLAARALRVGTRTRLADRLGLPRSTPGTALVDAVARASGTPRPDVEQLLDGPDPTTDRDLLLLAQRLADLEESVRNA